MAAQSKNPEKSEIGYPKIRIVENLTQDPRTIHAKFQPPGTTTVAVNREMTHLQTPETELQLYI